MPGSLLPPVLRETSSIHYNGPSGYYGSRRSSTCAAFRRARVQLRLTKECTQTRLWRVYSSTGIPSGLEKVNIEGEKIEGAPPKVEGSNVAAVDPYSLFPSKHFSEMSLMLALYFPIGCALATVRSVLWILLLAVDAPMLSNNDTMIKVLQFILGANVKWHNKNLIPDERYVMVSNHQTSGDLLCLYQLPHRIIHLVSSAIPEAATKIRNHRVKLQHATPEAYSKLLNSSDKMPVHLFPEGGMTNGTGMMQFTWGFMKFVKKSPVVPVALRVTHPFEVNVRTHTLTSPFSSNLFLFSFLPWVNLDATVLPPLKKKPDETSSEFVRRVQKKIADELQIPIAHITIKEKRQMMKGAKG